MCRIKYKIFIVFVYQMTVMCAIAYSISRLRLGAKNLLLNNKNKFFLQPPLRNFLKLYMNVKGV